MPIKDLVSLRPALAELERAVDWAAQTIDDVPFKLVPVIQTKGRKSKCMGWFSEDQWSTREGEMAHEITFCAEMLDSDPVDIVAVAVHEVVHFWTNYLDHGTGEYKDTSTGGRHNKIFKEYAEILGLVCAPPHDAYGWGYTIPSAELRERIEKEFQPDHLAFGLFRLVKPRTTPTVKTNAWTCYCKGLTLRIPAKQTLDATCHKCNEKFVPKEPAEKDNPTVAILRELGAAIERVGVNVFEAHILAGNHEDEHPEDYPFHTHNMIHEGDHDADAEDAGVESGEAEEEAAPEQAVVPKAKKTRKKKGA